MLLEIGKGKELVGSVEVFIVLAVAAFDLAVVSGGIRSDEFVADAQLGQGRFKEGGQMLLASDKAIGELGTIVGLNALNEEGEFFNTVSDKFGRRKGIVFRESLQITETAIFVKEGVLVEIASIFRSLVRGLPNQAALGDEFDIDLDPLARILHLLIRLGDILGIGKLHGHLAALAKESVQP